MKDIGCTTPFGLNKNHICTDTNRSKLALDLFKKMINRKTQVEECLYPCQFLRNMLMPSVIRKNDSETAKLPIIFHFDKFIKITHSYLAYTELELLAELGGYVGLFLGYSVFHLSALIEKILSYILPQ